MITRSVRRPPGPCSHTYIRPQVISLKQIRDREKRSCARTIMNTPVHDCRKEPAANDGAVVELVLERILGNLSGGGAAGLSKKNPEFFFQASPHVNPVRPESTQSP